MLVGLDGSPSSEVALQQAMLLARGFHATIVVAHIIEGDAPPGAELLAGARDRIVKAGLKVEEVERRGDPEHELAALARDNDVVLIGRTGTATAHGSVGPTAAAMLRSADVCVIVCASKPSAMRSIVTAFDGRDASKRALELAARFASIVDSTVHVVNANDDHTAGLLVVGEAEALLSLQQVVFQTHVEPGRLAEVAARVVQRLRCDVLFAGADIARDTPLRPSPVRVSQAEDILRQIDIPVVIQP